jgi:transposase-like protein
MPEGLQRVEVITGVGRRRRWPQEAKTRIVLESQQAGGAVVSEVARQHGLTPQQLFGWRRESRNGLAGIDARGSRQAERGALRPRTGQLAGQFGSAQILIPIIVLQISSLLPQRSRHLPLRRH